MGTVLFTDHDVLVFTTIASAMLLAFAVLLVSTKTEKSIGRLESRIRQVLIHQ